MRHSPSKTSQAHCRPSSAGPVAHRPRTCRYRLAAHLLLASLASLLHALPAFALPPLQRPPPQVLEPPRDLRPRVPPPSIESFAMPNDVVLRPGETSPASVLTTVKGLPANATVRILGLDAGDIQDVAEACFFSARSQPGALRSDAAGRLTVQLDGAIHAAPGREAMPNVNGFTGPCRPMVRVAIDAPGQPRETLAVGNTFRLAPLTLYFIQDTWRLRNIIRFGMQADAPGVCQGLSLPSGIGTIHPVGVMDVNGDIAFGIRSGPLGTACRAVAPPALVPAALRLRAIDWVVHRAGTQCDIGENRLPDGVRRDSLVIVPGAIPDEDPSRYCCSRTGPSNDILGFLRVTTPPRGPGQHYLNAMHVRLGCLPSASNDDAVRVTLRSISFDGPPGVPFP